MCAITFLGKRVRKTTQAKSRVGNQGVGRSWGMSLRVVGSHQSLA